MLLYSYFQNFVHFASNQRFLRFSPVVPLPLLLRQLLREVQRETRKRKMIRFGGRGVAFSLIKLWMMISPSLQRHAVLHSQTPHTMLLPFAPSLSKTLKRTTLALGFMSLESLTLFDGTLSDCKVELSKYKSPTNCRILSVS